MKMQEEKFAPVIVEKQRLENRPINSWFPMSANMAMTKNSSAATLAI
jgi:hypothetical protein